MTEPFLTNPGGRKPRGHKAGCGCVVCRRRHGGGHRRRRRSRRHRNPPLMVYNPRRRRRHARRAHRRRRYHNNPASVRGIIGSFKESLPLVLWGGVGAIGSEAVPGLLTRFGIPLPMSPPMQIGVKIGSGLGVSFLVGKLAGPKAGKAALVGALLIPVVDLFKVYAGPMLGIGAYTDAEPLGAYIDARADRIGYLGPAPTVGDLGDSFTPSRLNPDERL